MAELLINYPRLAYWTDWRISISRFGLLVSSAAIAFTSSGGGRFHHGRGREGNGSAALIEPGFHFSGQISPFLVENMCIPPRDHIRGIPVALFELSRRYSSGRIPIPDT